MEYSRFDHYIKRRREYCVRCRVAFPRVDYKYCDYASHVDVFGRNAFISDIDCSTVRQARHLCRDCDNEMDYDESSRLRDCRRRGR
jgi:hypothetical protein